MLVPQREGKANHLPAVTDSSQAVFVPAISARTGMVVWQVFPGVPVRAIVFTHSAPCTFAEVRPPALPMLFARARFGQSNFLVCHDSFSYFKSGLAKKQTPRNLQIAVPRAESGIVHRIVDA